MDSLWLVYKQQGEQNLIKSTTMKTGFMFIFSEQIQDDSWNS